MEKEKWIEEYYEEYIIDKIDTGQKLTELELSNMLWSLNKVSETEGDEGRWTRSMQTIFEINGRYFALDWDRGLTECQENEFWNQPYEVEKKEYTKTITVTEWNKKEKNNG